MPHRGQLLLKLLKRFNIRFKLCGSCFVLVIRNDYKPNGFNLFVSRIFPVAFPFVGPEEPGGKMAVAAELQPVDVFNLADDYREIFVA